MKQPTALRRQYPQNCAASDTQTATALHHQCPRKCHSRQRERPELLHCEAAAAPAQPRVATRPGDAYDLPPNHPTPPVLVPQSTDLLHREAGKHLATISELEHKVHT